MNLTSNEWMVSILIGMTIALVAVPISLIWALAT